MKLRWISSSLIAVAAFTLLAGTPAAPPTAGRAPAPKLAVLIAVDGMNYDRLAQYRPWYVAGLKRLFDEGQDFAATHYRHINTETGPGHASLGTGAPPRVSGIVANRWFEQNPDGSIRGVGCTTQWETNRVPGVPPLFYNEVAKDGRLYVFALRAELLQWQASGELGRSLLRPGDGPGGETVVFDSEDAITLFNLRHARPVENFAPKTTIIGPGNLRVATLGDTLVAAHPGARVVSVSGKDRASLFMAGRDIGHVVYWYDRPSGRFITSSVYDTSSGASATGKTLSASFNTRKAGSMLPGRFGLVWKKLTPSPRLPAILPTPFPDLADYQLPINGLGFDHDLTRPPNGYFDGIYYSPYVDELVADLALEFLEDPKLALGRGPTSDLLAISFSAQDTVSHSYGPESEEELDVLRRLDMQLGRLFDAFDRLYPRGSVVIGFSADHGFTPIPDAHRAEHPDTPGGRLVDTDRTTPNFIGRLNRLLSEELCLPAGSKPIFGSEGWSLIYSRPTFPLRSVTGPCGPAERLVTTKDLDAALPRVAKRFFGEEVRAVYTIAQRDTWRADDELVDFLRNDLDLERSGDAFVVPQPYVLMHWDPARGSGHGSTYEYDTHVPLIFWGGPFRAGRTQEPSAPYDLAPTLGELLGVELKHAIGHSRAPK